MITIGISSGLSDSISIAKVALSKTTCNPLSMSHLEGPNLEKIKLMVTGLFEEISLSKTLVNVFNITFKKNKVENDETICD